MILSYEFHGEFQTDRAGWEYAIYENLRLLLDHWPAKILWVVAVAKKNIAHYLKGRPSLQGSYTYQS